MKSAFYEPEPRYLHCSALVQDKWYNYGGMMRNDKEFSPSVIEEFDPAHQVWKQHTTHGDTPPGYIGSAATSIGSKFYHFGGFCGKKFHNTISELDVSTFQWQKLEPTNEDGTCPIPKMDAGMIAFDNRVLVIYGGKGVVGKRSNTAWTNELHYFDIITREWYIPTVFGPRGSIPTPCAGCTFTKVDYYRAVLFGGYGSDNCIRILDMMHQKRWVWSVIKPNSDLLWPDVRCYHSAISLHETGATEEESPRNPELMVLFGMDLSVYLMDSWLYNLNSKKWTLTGFPGSLVKKSGACVRNSTCLLYHDCASGGKTLFQFGGLTISSHNSSMNTPVALEKNVGEALYSIHGTDVFELDFVNNSLVITSAKHLKTSWLSIRPDHPEITFFEDERKQVLNLEPNKELHMDLRDVGMELRVQSESEGVNEVSVLPAIGGPFEMPDGYISASPVFLISDSNKELKKSFDIKMDHYVNLETEEDCNSMAFLSCSLTSGSEPTFKCDFIDEPSAKFTQGNRQGEITLQEAVPLCIARKSRKNSSLYCLKRYSTPSLCDNHYIVLSVCLFHELYLKLLSVFMKQHYPALSKTSSKAVRFEQDQIEISWSVGEKWKVISDKEPSIISQEEADLPVITGITFEDGEDYPPRIELTFLPPEESYSNFSDVCKVEVTGLSQYVSFNMPLSVNVKPKEAGNAKEVVPIQKIEEGNVEELVPIQRMIYLRQILSLLLPVASKWESIGIALDFSTGDLENIKHNLTLAIEGPQAYLRVLIQQWLGWTPPDHNLPTIEALCDALKSPMVNEQVLAEKMLQKVKHTNDKNLRKLIQEHPDFQDEVIDAIKNLLSTVGQWEDNVMTGKLREVANLIEEMMRNLQKPSKIFLNTEKIKFNCEDIARSAIPSDFLNHGRDAGVKDLKRCADSVVTISQLLHRQAHIQLTHSFEMEDKWVLAMESVIKQVIDLANALENVLIQADLVNLLTTNSDKWRRKKKKRSWSEAGFVETLSKQIGSSIIVPMPASLPLKSRIHTNCRTSSMDLPRLSSPHRTTHILSPTHQDSPTGHPRLTSPHTARILTDPDQPIEYLNTCDTRSAAATL